MNVNEPRKIRRAGAGRATGLSVLFFVLSAMPWVAAGTPNASALTLVVIVNAERPEAEITSSDLRRIFTGEQKFWSDSRRIQPILPPTNQGEAEVWFLKSALHQPERDFKQEWDGKIFRGEATAAPVRTADESSAVRGVVFHKNAVAVVEKESLRSVPADLMRGVKILRVDGKTPGEKGYPLM